LPRHLPIMKLNVPHIDQNDPYSCVPICPKMVLTYLVIENKIRVPDLTLDQIRKAVDTRIDGTNLDNVSKINRKLVRGASHRVEFMTSEGNAFDVIKRELAEGRPVIAWIRQTSDERVLGHSVVITGLDEASLTITYDDPMEGERTQNIPTFMREWDNNANVLVMVRVDRKPPQMELEDFQNASR